MSTRKTFISSIIINLLLISCGSSKQTVYPVKTYDEKLQTVSTVYDEDNKLGYTISQDNSHLYIMVNTQDKATQLKMMRNGVKVFFDDEGKKNKSLSVQYPVAKKRQAMNIEEMKKLRENGDKQELLKEIQASLGSDIKITEDTEERIINKELNNEGIMVNHQMSEDGLSYTLKVPVTYVESNANIKSVGISIEGMKRPDSNKGGVSVGGRPSGGMRGGGMRGSGGMRGGGRPGGKRGGQGNRPNMADLKDLQSNIEIWIPITLE